MLLQDSQGRSQIFPKTMQYQQRKGIVREIFNAMGEAVHGRYV